MTSDNDVKKISSMLLFENDSIWPVCFQKCIFREFILNCFGVEGKFFQSLKPSNYGDYIFILSYLILSKNIVIFVEIPSGFDVRMCFCCLFKISVRSVLDLKKAVSNCSEFFLTFFFIS